MVQEKQKILVTGASGFVGSALVRELQNAGKYEIFGLVGKRTEVGIAEPWGLKLFQTDISVDETLKVAEELGNLGTIVHTAGLAHQFGRVGREDFWRVNVRGTENLCRLAQKTGAGHFILISSVSVYGDRGRAEIDETFICRPDGLYAESKLESENRAIDFCERNNIRLTILRLATVIGEGDRGNTARLITAIDKGRFLWIGSGTNRKSLIYKTDAAKGILKTVEGAAEGGTEIYNLTAEAVSMQEIVGIIAQNLQKKTPGVKIPVGLVRGVFKLNKTGVAVERLKKFEKTFEKWLSDDIFSGEKFYEKYKFRTETTVSEALARQVRYYLNKKNKGF